VVLENAKKIPDLTVSGGVRRLNENDDTAFVMGFSVPLPLFDRNQGALRRPVIDWTRQNGRSKLQSATCTIYSLSAMRSFQAPSRKRKH